MNVKIIIFGTLFLLSNITLVAQEVNREAVNFSGENHQDRTRKSVRDELVERLVDNGLDDSTAEDMLKNVFDENDPYISIKIQNYLSVVPIDYDTLMEKILKRTLFGKKTDFSNYDTLISLTRESNSIYLDEKMLKNLSQIASINRNLRSNLI
jgi:hypothetical protein